MFKWIIVLIIGIVLGVTIQHYFDYQKSMKFYDTMIERTKQETVRLEKYADIVKNKVDKAIK